MDDFALLGLRDSTSLITNVQFVLRITEVLIVYMIQGERTGFLKPLLGMDLDEKIGYIKKRRNPCY
jgi:hypothetical protein